MFIGTITVRAKRGNELVKALRAAADALQSRLMDELKRGHKDWQPEWEKNVDRTLEALGELDPALTFNGISQNEKQGDTPHFEFSGGISGNPIYYIIYGVKPDGTEEELCGGYPSRGYCYSSFSMYYDGADVEGCTLRDEYTKLIVRDNDRRLLWEKAFESPSPQPA